MYIYIYIYIYIYNTHIHAISNGYYSILVLVHPVHDMGGQELVFVFQRDVALVLSFISLLCLVLCISLSLVYVCVIVMLCVVSYV